MKVFLIAWGFIYFLVIMGLLTDRTTPQREGGFHMKVFLITWGFICFLVIVGLLIVYTTDKLSGVSVAE